MKRLIYMDNAATTPLSGEVLEAMLPYLREEYGNPSAVYGLGQRARKAVDESRAKIAALIGAHPQEIYFSCGGTESDNWALCGAAASFRQKGRHIVTSKLEHHAVLRACAFLEAGGAEITYLDPDGEGRISPAAVAGAIRPDTVLVSIMFANNEIGTVEPIAEIGHICQERGVPFHTDAVQAMGHLPIQVDDMRIDYLSASAHKLNGPKGVGILYMRKGKALKPYLHGGMQERGRRAGTENVAGIVGFGRAAELADLHMQERIRQITPLRDHLLRRLVTEIDGCIPNGSLSKRLPGNISVCIEGVEGERLSARLDRCGIAAAAGAACTAGAAEASHVLKAIGRTHAQSLCGLRLSIAHDITAADADYAADTIAACVKDLRAGRG